MRARLHQYYKEEIVPALMREFGYSNLMEVPQVEKVTLNMGVGEGARDRKVLEGAMADMAAISGQKPIVTRARKSVAGFRIRAGMPIGCKVTLRRDRMYEFLDRFIQVALPRVRDFRGLNLNAFDGQGNYSIGINEQIIFPEINYDNIDRIRGLDVVLTTSASTDEEAKALLTRLRLPFKE